MASTTSNPAPTAIGNGVRDSQSRRADGSDIEQATAQNQPIVVAEWQKNKRDKFRVALELYHGTQCVDIRLWFTPADGISRPGKSGLKTSVRHLPKLAEAVAKALVEARSLGLVDAGDDTGG